MYCTPGVFVRFDVVSVDYVMLYGNKRAINIMLFCYGA